MADDQRDSILSADDQWRMQIPAFSREVCPVVPGPGWWIPASLITPARPATPDNSHEAIDALAITPASSTSPIPIVQHAMLCICPHCPTPSGPPTVQVPFKGTHSPYRPGIRSWGVSSGRRSTIIGASRSQGPVDWVIAYDVDGEPIYPNPDHPEFFLRLKGSGMWLPSEPFEFPGITLKPLPSMRHPGVDTIEIRGTAFPKTATSDIVNNPIINNMMKKLGLRSCNVPLGLWYYGNMDNDPAPNIPKACNVMKTLSDRRCESNLFAGLEEIVLSGIGSDEAESVMHQISKVYERFKIEPPGDANRTYVRADGLWKYGVNIMIESVMGTTLAGSIKDLTDWDVVRGGLAPSEDVYKAIAPTFRLPGDRPLIKIAKLFGRVGWEAGRCTAAVHRCGFDWGTYQDHLPDGMLDNAHANNLVVLPGELMDLGNERYQLLYPTDFDMSFKKEQAVNVDDRPPHPDPKFVEIIFQVEMGNMLMNIAGYTAALKGVVTGDWQRDPEPSPQMDLIWALRDIAVWEYFQGYKRPADPKYHGNDLILQDALLFVGEALERTIDVVV